MKWVMSRLNIHAFFHSTTAVDSDWFFKYKDIFFIQAIICIVGTGMLSRQNLDCVFLASMLNEIFVLLETLLQYQVTVTVRGVFRTLLHMMELFVKIGNGF